MSAPVHVMNMENQIISPNGMQSSSNKAPSAPRLAYPGPIPSEQRTDCSVIAGSDVRSSRADPKGRAAHFQISPLRMGPRNGLF